MIYNEQKLESFARKPFKYETQKVIDTHEAMREAIRLHLNKQNIKDTYNLGDLPKVDIFLQGSYKNDTDVTKSSDVDVVVRLETVWTSNKEVLPPAQLQKYNQTYSSVNYGFKDFNSHILQALVTHFGKQYISNDDKCLKIKEHIKFCNADVIPCLTYRNYGFFENANNQKFDEGIYFITNQNIKVVNYPKQHYDSLTSKSFETNGNFKSTVRMFKNIKDDLIDKGHLGEDVAKSYFIENLLFNVPNNLFSGTYTERFKNVLNLLIEQFNNSKFSGYYCANGIIPLFSSTAWSLDKVETFLRALIKVRDETQF